jgi:hypothetical protein
MPTGQLFELYARIPKQPIACSAEFDKTMPSAPNANALIKSPEMRRPTVMIKLISDLYQTYLHDPNVTALLPMQELLGEKYYPCKLVLLHRYHRHDHPE